MLEHIKVGFALHVLTRFNKSVLSYLLILQVMDEEKMDSLTLEVIACASWIIVGSPKAQNYQIQGALHKAGNC